MNDQITIQQLQRSYLSALKKLRDPYKRVLNTKENDKDKQGEFSNPPMALRHLFGVEDK